MSDGDDNEVAFEYNDRLVDVGLSEDLQAIMMARGHVRVDYELMGTPESTEEPQAKKRLKSALRRPAR